MGPISLRNKVTVHYTGRFADTGEVFDTTEGRAPLVYVEGAHEVVPGFEASVISMTPGERKTVTLEPKMAYGERRRELLRSIPTTDIPNYDDLVVGSLIYIMDHTGYQRLARVIRVQDDGDTILDFNHPMAGRTLEFDLELLSRESADENGGGDHA